MTVRDLIRKDVSVDVCDDYDERCYIAYEYGYKLTKAGRERFADALDIPVTGYSEQYCYATLHCETAKEATACQDLFYALAGYCGDSDFERWFEEV